MWKRRIRPHRVSVIPCAEKRGCFRWLIHAAGGDPAEASGYAFATVAGARASGEAWRRGLQVGDNAAGPSRPGRI